MDQVVVRVAGMSVPWKIWNVLFAFLPKCVLMYYTAKLGVFFLMETAGVDNIIVNSAALGFLLGLDELITQSLMSVQATALMEKCKGFRIKDDYDNALTDEEILDNFQSTDGGWRQVFFDIVFKH